MIVASLVTVIWVILLLMPDQPWRMRETLQSDPEATSGRRVTVLIPARNEEQVLPRNLNALSRQRVPMQVWVLDDGSTDHTR
ncbi:glycosyl transferase, group 2 family protein, partial [mine drainage metagenome]